MDFEKILREFLSVTLKNAENGELSALLENAKNGKIEEKELLDTLLSKDVERVEKLKETFDGGGKFQEGYAKGKKESLTDFEKQIKEKFKLDSDKQGVDLVNDLVTAKIDAVKDKNKVTEEVVKAHPVYQSLESRLLNEKKEVETNYQKQIEELQSDFQKRQTFNRVKDEAERILSEMNPILPKSKEASRRQKEWFISDLKSYEFKDADGKLIALKDGKVVQDAHGNTRSFDDIVRQHAQTSFDFQKNNGGGNTGGGQNHEGGEPTNYESINWSKIEKPLEYVEKMSNDPNLSDAEKIQIAESYDKFSRQS